MKIIEPGPEFKLPWSYVTDCKKCKAKVEVELEDVMKGDDSAWNDSGPSYCLYWLCPFCGNDPNLPRPMWKAVQMHRPELKF